MLTGWVPAQLATGLAEVSQCDVPVGDRPRSVAPIAMPSRRAANTAMATEVVPEAVVEAVIAAASRRRGVADVSKTLPAIGERSVHLLLAHEGGGRSQGAVSSVVNAALVSGRLLASARTGGSGPGVAIADRGVGIAGALR
jgi:hypothetical protein